MPVARAVHRVAWRRIDLQALQTRIEAGELVDTEASWYHREKTEKAGQGRE